VLKKYTLNKKLFEESSRNVYSEYLEDSTGKEELYLRKIKSLKTKKQENRMIILVTKVTLLVCTVVLLLLAQLSSLK
jgi:hypothetical protein